MRHNPRSLRHGERPARILPMYGTVRAAPQAAYTNIKRETGERSAGQMPPPRSAASTPNRSRSSPTYSGATPEICEALAEESVPEQAHAYGTQERARQVLVIVRGYRHDGDHEHTEQPDDRTHDDQRTSDRRKCDGARDRPPRLHSGHNAASLHGRASAANRRTWVSLNPHIEAILHSPETSVALATYRASIPRGRERPR